MTFLRGSTFWMNVGLKPPRRRQVSLGTKDPRIAREIERMLKLLRDRREWELLYAAVEGPLSPGEVYDYWSRGQVDTLRARLSDDDLRDHVGSWQEWLTSLVREQTAQKYLRQLRHLVLEDEPFLRSELTRSKVVSKLHEIARIRSGSTTRRYHAAFRSFLGYLVDIEVIEQNPILGIKLARENPARNRYLSLDLSLRLVGAHPQPFRALAALREGAGVEESAARLTHRRDVDSPERIVHIHGIKNANRDRPVVVDREFWPHVEDHIRSFLPDAQLWEGLTYDAVLHQHRKACAALQIDDYRIHDARHSYAVRHMRAGDDVYLIARNLGHANAHMVHKVYGKYRPTLEDLRRLSGTEGGKA